MKIYIAAIFSMKDEVKKLYQVFESQGHTITRDWTIHIPTQPEERDEKNEMVAQYAIEDIDGVLDAEVLVFLSDGFGGKGRYIELGAAIHSQIEKGLPHIYVVGNNLSDSIFYYHPSIKRRSTIEEVLEELK